MAIRNNLKQVLSTDNLSNPSLILQKYLEMPAGDDKDSSNRNRLMDKAVNSLSKISQIYTQAYNNWKSFLPKDTKREELSTDGNIIVGLGSDNVLETGITLHHTYGVPYIPGTALKGLAAHYCNQNWGNKDDNFKKGGVCYKEIFGDTTQAGHIRFWDAWITPQTLSGCLKKDIMTPHNTKYYSASDNTPPSDYESPNPISFLSVQGTFTIALSCDVNNDEGKKWVELTFELLKSALRDWGVGAKTSSGYGRFKINTGSIDGANVVPQNEFEKFKAEFMKNKNSWMAKPQQSTLVTKIKVIRDVNLQQQAKEFIKGQIKEKDRSKPLVELLNS